MFKIIPWDDTLDLSEFYIKAAARGFLNNSSQEVMIDCFKNEKKFQVWILYQDEVAIGSVAAHTLPLLGENAYRICARTCAFAEARPSHGLLTRKRMVEEYQHLTAQFFFPTCIEWVGLENDMYISSHPSAVGSQRLVNDIYLPTLSNTGTLERTCELEYRGHLQTFWKLRPTVFLEQLNRYPRWN